MEAVNVLRLTPVELAPTRPKLGTAKGDFVVPGDFDAPLSEEIVEEFEH